MEEILVEILVEILEDKLRNKKIPINTKQAHLIDKIIVRNNLEHFQDKDIA